MSLQHRFILKLMRYLFLISKLHKYMYGYCITKGITQGTLKSEFDNEFRTKSHQISSIQDLSQKIKLLVSSINKLPFLSR